MSGVQSSGNQTIDDALARSIGNITGGADAGRTALGTGYDTSTGAVSTGANDALSYLDQGTRDALARLGIAGDSFKSLDALGTKYGRGTDLLLDSYGVNGADGTNRATQAFQAGPGYNFTLDQGINSIARLRNAQTGGSGVGGNADRDAINYATGVANQSYNDWRNGLQGFVSPELAATSGAATGQAGVATNAANVVNTAGQNKAQVASSRGSMLADLASKYGINLSGIDMGEGQTLAGLNTGAAGQKVGLSTAIANPYSGTYKTEADAQMAGSGNLWNLGLQVAKLAAGAAGGAPTGGSVPSGSGGGFSTSPAFRLFAGT